MIEHRLVIRRDSGDMRYRKTSRDKADKDLAQHKDEYPDLPAWLEVRDVTPWRKIRDE